MVLPEMLVTQDYQEGPVERDTQELTDYLAVTKRECPAIPEIQGLWGLEAFQD